MRQKLVHAVEHGLGHEGLHQAHLGTGLLEQAGGMFHGGAHFVLDWQAAASVQQQAQAQATQALHALVAFAPGDGLVGQAHAVARIGRAQHLHHQRGVLHGACYGPAARPV